MLTGHAQNTHQHVSTLTSSTHPKWMSAECHEDTGFPSNLTTVKWHLNKTNKGNLKKKAPAVNSFSCHDEAAPELEQCHLKQASHTFPGLGNSIFLLCLHCWFLPLQCSHDCLNAITWAVNGNAPDQSNTSVSGWTEICCWNMIFSLFVEISSPHSKMKINGYICQPRPICQLVDAAAGWIDFF